MIDKEVISSRISTIKAYSNQLKSLLEEADQSQFASDPKLFLLGERLLEIIIQAMIDMSSHLISGLSLEKPGDYREIVTILIRHKIIPDEFGPKMHSLIGLRNLLAHEYITIDHRRLYEDATAGLSDFADFCRTIVQFLEAK